MMTEINVIFLIFLCVIQGTHGALIQYNASATAVEGQNVSLHCIVGEDQLVTQLEWIKHLKGNGTTEQKIVVYHPLMKEHYYQRGPFLETVTSPKTGRIQGSILTLYGVTVKDSGNYICEITSFPNGSIKRSAELQVTEAPASVKMSDSYEFITEGDELKITCSATPPPLRYKLQRSKDKLFIKESPNGQFILPNITRDYSDVYMCLPEWSLSHHNQQRLNATLELTVNFLDAIECNTSSPLNVSFGEDVAISCKAKASQYLKYKWMRGDVKLSLSDTLSLTSVTSDQAGTYKFTAGFQNNTLQKHVDFYIHVISKQSKETTTVSPVRTTQHLSSLTSVRSSSWSSGATESRTTQSVKPNATVTKLQPQLTSRHTALTGGSSAPPAGSASTLHASTLRSTERVQETVQTRFNINTATGTTVNPTTRRYTAVTTYSVTTNKLTTISVAIQKDSRSSAYVAIPIVLLVLLLIALLYRRYLNQKKMDMPPPFKPPPPPVKYTSVRHHEVIMTDILV